MNTLDDYLDTLEVCRQLCRRCLTADGQPTHLDRLREIENILRDVDRQERAALARAVPAMAA